MPKLHRTVTIYVRVEDAWIVDRLRAALAPENPRRSLSMLTVEAWRLTLEDMQARAAEQKVQATAEP